MLRDTTCGWGSKYIFNVRASYAQEARATMELFAWMQRHPEKHVSRVLAWPGHELQHRLSTAEPSPAQLEVAEAALAACLELEDA